MKQIFTLMIVSAVILLIAGGALAVPRLQTYIVGSEYGASGLDDGSWMTANSSFDLKVAGYWGAATQNRPYYDWMGVGLIIGVPRDEAGSVWINGMEIYRSPEMPAGDPDWDTAAATHESSNEPAPDLDPPLSVTGTALGARVNGTNELALGVWNDSPASDDLVVYASLSILGVTVDNCPTVYNPDQRDADGDRRGDACDPGD